MNILLLSVPMDTTYERDAMKVMPPLGVYVLAGVLREHGYEVEVYDHEFLADIYDGGWPEDVIEELVYGMDLVGISSNSFNWGVSKQLIEKIKSLENPPYVFCGGVHPTFYYRHIMENTQADAVIMGDGEEPIIGLVEGLEHHKDLSRVKNLIYRENGIVYYKPFEKYKEFIDYGEPAFDLIPKGVYYNMPVETSRGCYFHCAFCSILDSHNWRGLDAASSIKRIEKAGKLAGDISIYDSVYIADNCFTGSVERATDIFDNIMFTGESYKIHFEARCTDVLKDNAKFVKSINPERVNSVQIGIESGYDEGLKLLNKGLSTKQIRLCMDTLQEIDVAKKAFLSFVIGLPWEGRDDCEKTIEFAHEMERKYGAMVGINWWLPLKSRLTDEGNKYGIVIPGEEYDNPTWVKNPKILKQTYQNLSREDLIYLHSKYKDDLHFIVDVI